MTAAETKLFRVRANAEFQKQNLTQAGLAAAAGVTQPTISRLFSGATTELDDNTALKLAQALHKTPTELKAPGTFLTKPTIVGRMLASSAKELLKKAGTAAFQFATGGLLDGLKSSRDALAELAAMSPEHRAWVLIHRSLVATVDDLLERVKVQHPQLVLDELAEAFTNQIEAELQSANLIIDQLFFDHPAGAFVHAMQQHLRVELEKAGLKKAEARNAVASLPTYFVYALHAEERANETDYSQLREQGGPLAKAVQREEQWAVYRYWLQREMAKPVFGSLIPLQDLYIRLRCWLEFHDNYGETHNELVWLEDQLQKQWLDPLVKTYDAKQAIRFITAGAGSGKSTSSKALAAYLAHTRQDISVIFVPLHLWLSKESLPSALDQFCNNHNPTIPTGALNETRHDGLLLLILDGLDELAKAGDSGLNTARQLVSEYCQWISMNQQARCAILFAGRPIATDYAANNTIPSEFVLHLAQYDVACEVDAPEIEQLDQRHEWWAKYSTALGKPLTGMPKGLDDRGVAMWELTSQPLMGYLVARAYLQEPRKVDFGEKFQLSALYADALAEVYQKNYGPTRQHPTVEHLKQDVYEELLEWIGWCAWTDGGRAVTESRVQEALPKHLKSKLKEIGGAESLFLSFLLGPKLQANQDKAYEFTHKSFGEYLAARHLARQTHHLFSEWQRKQQSSYGGLDERGVLVQFAQLFGPTRLTDAIEEFAKPALAMQFQANLMEGIVFSHALLSHVLRMGLPMELALAGNTFQEMNQQAIHAEEAVLVFRQSLVELSGKDVERFSDWPSDNSAYIFLSRLVTSLATDISLAVRSLHKINMEHANLSCADMIGADMTDAVLIGTNFYKASLTNVVLLRADLRDANLRRADLTGADLTGADLTGADLTGANLEDAIMRGSKLQKSQISVQQLKQIIGDPDWQPEKEDEDIPF